MHIAIDARLIDTSTGVYIQRLVHFLHELDTQNNYTILAPSHSLDLYRDKYPRFRWEVADQPIYSFAEQLSFAWKLYSLKVDLVHFTMPQQPLLYLRPTITTVHDTTLVRFDNIDINPLVYRLRKAVFIYLLKTVCRRSKAILVPTDYVRKDLIDYIKPKNPSKYITTLEAGDPVDADPEVIGQLQGKRYLTFVGNHFPYKNVQRLVEAYAELKTIYPDLELAIGGRIDHFTEQLQSFVSENNIKDVHFLGFISDGEKRWLYRNAVAMVTASLSEGFCIPLLEAMYENCPVVASNASCLPEVASEAALYFDPHSTTDLTEKLTKLLDNPSLRQDLIARGQERVKQFSWQQMAEDTLRAYSGAFK